MEDRLIGMLKIQIDSFIWHYIYSAIVEILFSAINDTNNNLFEEYQQIFIFNLNRLR